MAQLLPWPMASFPAAAEALTRLLTIRPCSSASRSCNIVVANRAERDMKTEREREREREREGEREAYGQLPCSC